MTLTPHRSPRKTPMPGAAAGNADGARIRRQGKTEGRRVEDARKITERGL